MAVGASLLGRDEKAEERTVAMPAGDQSVDMLSGKAGSSIMNTSLWERRPRMEAEESSSRLRASPRPSALPTP